MNPEEIKSVPCTSCGTMTEQDQLNNVDWDWWGTCNDCTEEPDVVDAISEDLNLIEGLAKDITAEYVFLSGENIADEDNELLITIKNFRVVRLKKRKLLIAIKRLKQNLKN